MSGVKPNWFWWRFAVGVFFASLTGCQSCLVIQPGAYPCQADAGDAAQCPAGWRCGLVGRCHATGAPAAYTCITDSDCEAAWRCSALGVCVDPGNETLSDTQYEGPLDQELLNPLILDQSPVLFAHSGQTFPDSSRASIYVSMLDGGVLEEISLLTPADGGPLTRSENLFSVGIATALAASGPRSYALIDGGALEVDADGGTWFLPVSGGAGLRLEPPGPAFAVLTPDAGYVLVQPVPRTSKTIQMPGLCSTDPVLDLVELQAHLEQGATTGSGPACMLAVTPSGMFYANYSLQGDFLVDAGVDGGTSIPPWSPVPAGYVGAPTCGVTSDAGTVQQLFPSYDGLGVSVLSPGGEIQEGLIAYDGQSADAGVWTTCETDNPCCGRLGQSFILGPCSVCGPLLLAEVRPIATSPLPAMDVHCVDPLSGASSWFIVTRGAGTSCGNPFPLFTVSALFTDQVIYNAALPQDHPYAGAHGELWNGGVNRRDENPQLLDQRPNFFLELDGGLLTVSDSMIFDSTGNNVVAQDTSSWSAGQGFLLQGTRTDNPYAGRVAGQPDWVISQDLIVTDLDAPNGFDVVAVSTQASSSLDGIGGVVVPIPGGGSELVVWADDTLYSADVTARLVPPLSSIPSVLVSRLVPAPGNQIQRVVFLPVSDGGTVVGPDGTSAWARGYILTKSGVFELSADSEVSWEDTPISTGLGQPRAVWLDGHRGRLGFSDGTVQSLPGLVPLAGPIPESSPSVSGFASLCGEGYALGSDALYRLARNPDGGVLGVWLPEALPLPFLDSTGTAGFPGGGLQGFHDHVYVSTSFGEVVRLSVDGGCN